MKKTITGYYENVNKWLNKPKNRRKIHILLQKLKDVYFFNHKRSKLG
jgi:hypothetical protein